MASRPALDDALRHAVDGDARTVLVDLTEVTFLATSGVVALLHAAERLRRRRRSLVTVCPDPSVRRVFELTDTAWCVGLRALPLDPKSAPDPGSARPGSDAGMSSR